MANGKKKFKVYKSLSESSFPPICSSSCSHQAERNQLFYISQIIFIATAMTMILALRQEPFFNTMSITFVSIFLEALPFIIIGSLIGGVIEVFVPKWWICNLFDRLRFIAIFAAGGFGIIFPICECASVPIVRRLLQKGLPLGASVAFLLAGPIVNPLVATSTAIAYGFDWSIAMDRTIHGYLIATTIGVLMEMVFRPHQAVKDDLLSQKKTGMPLLTISSGCSCHPDNNLKGFSFTKTGRVLEHSMHDFLDIGKFLIIGSFLAGLFQAIIPRSAVIEIANSPALSVFTMMALSFLMNLCSEADAFVAASFQSVSISLSAQLSFLLMGPMLDMKLLLMYSSIFKKKALSLLCASIVILIFLSMLIKGIF